MNIYLRIIILSILFGSSTLKLKSEVIFKDQPSAKSVSENKKVQTDQTNADILFTEFKDKQIALPADPSTWILSFILKNPAGISLKLKKTEKDNLGYTHYRFAQYYHDVKIEDAAFYLHTKNGFVVSANGERITIENINMDVSADFSTARKKFIKQNNLDESCINYNRNPYEKVIFKTEDGFVLCYKTIIDIPSNQYSKTLYFKTSNGDLVTENNNWKGSIDEGFAFTKYSGGRKIITSYRNQYSRHVLVDSTRGKGIETLTIDASGSGEYNVDNDNIWALNSPIWDAHFNAEQTFDFFLNRYGRSSFDGAGSRLTIYVDTASYQGSAYYTGRIAVSGASRTPRADVLSETAFIGHEFTHGVINSTAALGNPIQTQGLGEAICDMFGAVIDSIVNPGTDYYRMGEEALDAPKVIRTLSDPLMDHAPDTYNGHYTNGNDRYKWCSIGDYWFYLLSHGGSGVNDNGSYYSVDGIGMMKVADMMYRCLTVYLTPASAYSAARQYSIQSAIDLFGNCSNEVKQVTNAWYAVGVGAAYTEEITAAFTQSEKVFCSVPATVNFIPFQTNAANYQWDFGDATNSSQTNPSHTYNAPGIYDVKLIVNGTATCNVSDTIIKTQTVIVSAGLTPIQASCAIPVASVNDTSGYGIYQVDFAEIHNKSSYRDLNTDYTCSFSASLIPGDYYPIKVTTNGSESERVKVWIDYNNNGIFDLPGEEVFSSNAKEIHEGIIDTDPNAVIGVPLRMRICSDDTLSPNLNSCGPIVNGQCEDYTIIFSSPLEKPIADFNVNRNVIIPNTSITFEDLSLNGATAWNWSFPGGNPSSSTLQNPVVNYPAKGNYAVQLIASNANGADTLIKNAFIAVVNYDSICGATTSSTVPYGVVFDSGGPFADYGVNQDCLFGIINPDNSPITIGFSEFDLENSSSNNPRVRIRNEWTLTTTFTEYLQNNPPPSGDIKINSNKVLLQFINGCCNTASGFEMYWKTNLTGMDSIIADFNVDLNPPFATNIFPDPTTNFPVSKYKWDFGNNCISSLKNPSQKYFTSGPQTIQLIASNYYSADTVQKTITVQQPPLIDFMNDTIVISYTCGDSGDTSFVIHNNGLGDLVLNFDTLQHISPSRPLKALLFFPRNDLSDIDIYASMKYLAYINGIDLVIESATPDSTDDFDKKMRMYDFIISAVNYNHLDSTTINNIKEYVEDGGKLLFFRFDGIATQLINYTACSGNFNYAIVNDNTHPLTYNLADTTLISLTNGICFTDSAYVSLANAAAKSVLGYKPLGKGMIVFDGLSYTDHNALPDTAMLNLINWMKDEVEIDPVIIPQVNTIIINPGDSAIINVTVNSDSLLAGDNIYPFHFISNDTSQIDVIKYFNIKISGSPEITFIDSICHTFLTNDSIAIDSVEIYNKGCDFLHISNVTVDPPFSLISFPDVVAPHQGEWIKLSCQITAQGIYNSTLFVENDDHDTSICLTAETNAVVANFLHKTDFICGNTKTFENKSRNSKMNIWDFGDAVIDTTSDLIVSHTYAVSGNYTIKLTAINDFGSDIYTDTADVFVVAGDISITGLLLAHAATVFTASNIQPGTTLNWNFGDNTSLVPITPALHTYSAIGNYNVRLTLYDADSCIRYIDTLVAITSGVGINENQNISGIAVVPNPFNGESEISFSIAERLKVEMNICSADGKIVLRKEPVILAPGKHYIKTGKLNPGLYFLNLNCNEQRYTIKLICVDSY